MLHLLCYSVTSVLIGHVMWGGLWDSLYNTRCIPCNVPSCVTAIDIYSRFESVTHSMRFVWNDSYIHAHTHALYIYSCTILTSRSALASVMLWWLFCTCSNSCSILLYLSSNKSRSVCTVFFSVLSFFICSSSTFREAKSKNSKPPNIVILRDLILIVLMVVECTCYTTVQWDCSGKWYMYIHVYVGSK